MAARSAFIGLALFKIVKGVASIPFMILFALLRGVLGNGLTSGAPRGVPHRTGRHRRTRW